MSSKKAIERCRAQRPAQDPQRPGSRLRKNAPVIGRAAQIAEHAAVVKRRQEREAKLAAAAARGRAEAHAEWVAEVKECEKLEGRRQRRIKNGGLRVADVQEVIDLARNMCGGIGPVGIAKTATVRVVGEELTRRVREAAHRQRLAEKKEQSKRTDQEDNFVQGMALALAELNRKFDQPTEVAEVLRDAGLDDLDTLRKAGVDQYDLDELAKCLPSTPDPDWRKGAKQRAARLCAKHMSRATGHNIVAKDVE